MPEQKVFCGSVFPHKQFADYFDLRLDVEVLRQYIYTGQDREGNPCRYVNISVKKSQQGNWYTEINQFKPQRQDGQNQQQNRPPAPPTPPQRPPPPPFPAKPPPPPAPAAPAQPPADQAPWPQQDSEPPMKSIEF